MRQTPGKTPEAKAKYWIKIIEAARRYPEGITAYCRYMDVSKNNYYFWFKRLRPDHPEWHDLTNHPEIVSKSRRKQVDEGAGGQPEVEVALTTRRRKWSISDKARILEETDEADPSELGSILRREGLYVHNLNKWRTERDLLEMAQQKKPGPRNSSSSAENKKLKDENTRLVKKLRNATEIIKTSKKNFRNDERSESERRLVAKEVTSLTKDIGNVSAVCSALGLPRASYYRYLQEPTDKLARAEGQSHRALTAEETQEICDVLHEIRFVDKAPAEIHATLLDEGRHIGSVSTMYRLLRKLKEVQERRKIARHHNYERPELLATGPNQVWSWDITKLKGPRKGTYYYLYVIIDIYSRYTVGWLLADREKAEIARHLIEETCERQSVDRETLTIHSDRGSSMNSKLVADLLIELGVAKSLNRPHVSNDNPYSESQFKTLKYRPEFPARFGCIEDARSLCIRFFQWYNNEHYHSGIHFLRPSTVHYGFAEDCLRKRYEVLKLAFEANPPSVRKGRAKAHFATVSCLD